MPPASPVKAQAGVASGDGDAGALPIDGRGGRGGVEDVVAASPAAPVLPAASVARTDNV